MKMNSSKQFQMNNYRLQYWLYAILNKKFGKEVNLERDSLHRLYKVNRHGFEVSTNTQSLNDVEKYFIHTLKDAGFEETDQSGTFCLKKTVEDNEKTEDIYISIHKQKHGLDHRNSDRPVLLVNGSVYKRKK